MPGGGLPGSRRGDRADGRVAADARPPRVALEPRRRAHGRGVRRHGGAGALSPGRRRPVRGGRSRRPPGADALGHGGGTPRRRHPPSAPPACPRRHTYPMDPTSPTQPRAPYPRLSRRRRPRIHRPRLLQPTPRPPLLRRREAPSPTRPQRRARRRRPLRAPLRPGPARHRRLRRIRACPRPAYPPAPRRRPLSPARHRVQPWPDSAGAPASASPPGGGGWPQAGAVAQDHAVARAAAAPDVSMAPGAGGGGATFQQLVDDPRITFPPSARADFLSGDIDPRFIPILERLAREHPIGLSVVKTGHDQFVAGTNVVSNHFKGRALDIATVDGAPVGPGNAAAREVMTELANLDPAVRPSEVGGPWLISAPGFFSDAGHQDHIHVGFDSPAPAEAQAPAPGPPEAQSPVQPPPEAQTPAAQTLRAGRPGHGASGRRGPGRGPGCAGRCAGRRCSRHDPVHRRRPGGAWIHPRLSPWRSPAAPALQGPARCMTPPPAAVARAAASTWWRPPGTTPGTTRPRRPSRNGWPSGRSVPVCHLSFR